LDDGHLSNPHALRRRDMQEQVITADMPIGEVVARFPETIHVFMRHGLGCVGCAVARFENVRQGAEAHGINVDALMKDLNEAVLNEAALQA
jgi:hybrid cluster-associated redox disulfide protein